MLQSDGRFVIKDYNRQRAFSNFLPGIAGLYGRPMWAFYVNRGQGIASFGTKNKDNAILEFYPANKAYQNVTTLGFRTFIKFKGTSKNSFYEPFRENDSDKVDQQRSMGSHEFSLKEMNARTGLEVSVDYFTLPNEPIAALAREVTFTNRSSRLMDLEVLDGLPMVNPFGMNEFFIKNMSRTIEAWMVAENLSKKAPFFRLKVDATDRPEVTPVREGNFYLGLAQERDGRARLLDVIVDPAIIFGSLLDFSRPKEFIAQKSFCVPERQFADNKTPCAFGSAAFKIEPGRSKTLRFIFGQADSIEALNKYTLTTRAGGYFQKKRQENHRLIEQIKTPIFTVTSNAAYDLYCGQTYLDNVLRGGTPVLLGGGERALPFYVYSRKHGDLERDYNQFLVDPTYFSQGNGNYRDVNQNRRSDVWFEPRVGDVNIRTFLNLVQADGFNPLVVRGARFHYRRGKSPDAQLKKLLGAQKAKVCGKFLSRSFNPGELYDFLQKIGCPGHVTFEKLLDAMGPNFVREEKADHGEGFWIDHWTYNLDLIESYLAIYPEQARRLIFEDRSYVFYDNDHRVQPRNEKYFLTALGQVRQYRSVIKDAQKSKLIGSRLNDAAVMRVRHGRGAPYRTTLLVKLLCLFANKLASLDPAGIGIEMEADKPSWYDALNGLPGLFGSSLPETLELKRLALFLIHAIDDQKAERKDAFRVPVEIEEFIRSLGRLLSEHIRSKGRTKNYEFWDLATSAKERYRQKTRLGFSGAERAMTLSDVRLFLEHSREKIEMGLERALANSDGIYPTYFENRVTRYRVLSRREDGVRVKALEFKQSALPLFLEGPVHALKLEKDPNRRKKILSAVRRSPLYDTKLGMYKVNAPLGSASLDIGRARVFAPGWLENESIWLHMEYKFLLELLRSGMADEFYADFRKAAIPYQNAQTYGRSILENSSFIVSSAFRDPSLHGGGYVARLSGSTAEFLMMWLLMNVGKRPFLLGPDGKLSLRFQPQLPADWFTRQETVRVLRDERGHERQVRIPKNCVAFLFLGKSLVCYHNPKRQDSFGKQRVSVRKITLHQVKGGVVEFKGDTVPAPYAARVRDERVPRIDIELG